MKPAIRIFLSSYCILTALALSACNFPGAACGKKSEIDRLTNRFQREVDAIVREYDLPGMTAAFVLADGTSRAFASGFADRELGLDMRADARMLAASIGKSFTGALALDLVREGRLELDVPITRYLAAKKWLARLPNYETITPRHLLTHSSGIADHVHTRKFQFTLQKYLRGEKSRIPPEELISFILDTPARFKPGKGFHYSDTGYILVGLIIEKVTGQSLFSEIKKRFILPLGLKQTEPSDRKNLPGLASGYLASNKAGGFPAKTTIRPGLLVWDPGIEWAGGGFISNSRDLAIWGKALYEGDALPGKYLPELLRGVRVRPNVSYGIATVINTDPEGLVSCGHKGWIPGYVSSLRYYTNHRTAIAFQINTDSGFIGQKRDVLSTIEKRLANALPVRMSPRARTGAPCPYESPDADVHVRARGRSGLRALPVIWAGSAWYGEEWDIEMGALSMGKNDVHKNGKAWPSHL